MSLCNVRAMDRGQVDGVQTERNIQMKALSIAALLAAASFAVVPAFASDDSETYTIHGYSELALESALHERGVDASHLEEWGGLIRGWVPNGNGGTTMQFFDAGT